MLRDVIENKIELRKGKKLNKYQLKE